MIFSFTKNLNRCVGFEDIILKLMVQTFLVNEKFISHPLIGFLRNSSANY